jgi:hypothetical protein
MRFGDDLDTAGSAADGNKNRIPDMLDIMLSTSIGDACQPTLGEYTSICRDSLRIGWRQWTNCRAIGTNKLFFLDVPCWEPRWPGLSIGPLRRSWPIPARESLLVPK